MEGELGSYEQHLTDLVRKQVEATFNTMLDDYLRESLTISSLISEMRRRYQKNEADLENHTKDYQALERNIRHATLMIDFQQQEINRLKQHSQATLEALDTKASIADLETKADLSELRTIKSNVQEMCPIDFAYQLEEEVKQRATNADLNTLIDRLNSFRDSVYAEFLLKVEAEQVHADMEVRFTEKLGPFATKDYVAVAVREATEQSEATRRAFEEFKGKLTRTVDSMTSTVHSMKDKLRAKADESALANAITVINSKASLDQLEITEHSLKLRLEALAADAAKVSAEQLRQEGVLQRLDEVLLEKASKLDLRGLGMKVESVLRHSDLEDKIDDFVRTSTQSAAELQILTESMNNLQTLTSNMQRKLERSVKDRIELQLMKEQVGELRTSVSYKTERAELFPLLEERAKVADARQLRVGIEVLHRNMKMLAVQLGTLYTIVSEPYRLNGLDRKQKEFSSQTTQKLVNFILSMQPTDSIVVPDDLQGLLSKDTPATERVQSARTSRRRVSISSEFLMQ